MAARTVRGRVPGASVSASRSGNGPSETSRAVVASEDNSLVSATSYLSAATQNLVTAFRGVADEAPRSDSDGIATARSNQNSKASRSSAPVKATKSVAASMREKQAELRGANPFYLAWALKCDLLRLWWARLPFEHTFLSAFTRFNYQQDRIMRLGQLLAVIFVSMFATAFFYSVTGATAAGIDEDCDGQADFEPLALWEQAVFSVMASLLQLPASVILTVLFGMAGDACFLWRYFPIWRELEIRGVAEVHLGSKVGKLRRRLQVLQTSLANWIERTDDAVTMHHLNQLKRICRLLGDHESQVHAFISDVMRSRQERGRTTGEAIRASLREGELDADKLAERVGLGRREVVSRRLRALINS